MKHYIFLLLGVVLMGSSCSMLDTEPYDTSTPDEFYSTEQEVEMALNGVYAQMAGSNLYGGDILARMGLAVDIGYEYYSSDQNTVGDYDIQPSDPKVQKYWRYFYEGIGRANMLMEHIDNAKLPKKQRDNIYAQALFLRAYYHFMLVVRFRNIPMMLHTVADGTASSVQVEQADPRDVYRQIIADMEEAAPYLSTAEELQSPGRVSQSTAYGILARVALNFAGYPLYEKGMYAKAKEYTEKVIATNFHRLNPSYEELFKCYIQDRYDVRESIWEVEFYGNNEGTYSATAGRVGRDNGIAYSNQTNSRTTMMPNGKTIMENYGYSIGIQRASAYYLNLFEEGDQRRDWTIAPYRYNPNASFADAGYKDSDLGNWEHSCGKFRREYELSEDRTTSYTPINFPLLRYSDVLLMWAESVIADKTTSDAELAQAREYINWVRRRGYGVDLYTPNEAVDTPDAGRDELYEVLKDERARELGYECLRKDDVIRWGEWTTRMQFMRNTVDAIPSSYTSTYYTYVWRYYRNMEVRDELWPIPTTELGVNSKLKQNPGW